MRDLEFEKGLTRQIGKWGEVNEFLDMSGPGLERRKISRGGGAGLVFCYVVKIFIDRS